MRTTPAKRIEIIIEAPALPKLSRALEAAGATGYTVLPVFGGYGRTGAWTREGEVSGGQGMVAVLVITQADRVEALTDAVYEVMERQIGVMAVSDCAVVREERF